MKKRPLYLTIAALILLNMFTLYKLNSLENNINNEFQQNRMSTSDLKNDINNISSNVEEKLKKQGSILDSHNLVFGEFNPSDLTVPIMVSITPKEYSKGLTASLLLNNQSIPMKYQDTSFFGTVNANIFNDLQLKLALSNNGNEKIETIENLSDLKGKYLLEITGGFSGESTFSTNQYQFSGKINLQFSSPQSNAAEKVTLINDVNGVIFNKKDLTPEANLSIDLKDRIPLMNGEKLTTYALIQDRYGLNYKYLINVYTTDSNGKVINNLSSLRLQEVTEISDKNGKTLFSSKSDK